MQSRAGAFSPDWLALREPFDTQVRSRELARRFVNRLPEAPRLLDLGAGAGSQFRWLAPMIGGPQHWLFADDDGELLEQGLRRTAAWAKRLGHATRHDEDWAKLAIETPGGGWHIDTIDIDLSAPPSRLPLDDMDAVTCNAWLDLVTKDWLNELLCAIGRRPFYASITVDGRDRIRPRRRDDMLVWGGYLQHQFGDKGFRDDALGPDVLPVMREVCDKIGLQCIAARSDWHVRPNRRAMLHALLGYWTRAARETLPTRGQRIGAWERDRRAQVETDRLAMRIGHRDILVFPRGGPRHVAGRDRR
jgi:hypothetical protein